MRQLLEQLVPTNFVHINKIKKIKKAQTISFKIISIVVPKIIR